MKNSLILSGILLLMSCSVSQKTTNSSKMQTLTGTFVSKKGVMTSLSCYCFNGGYLTTSDGTNIAICFPNDEANVDCKRVKIQGEYETFTREKDQNGICPEGKMTYFKVKEWKCVE